MPELPEVETTRRGIEPHLLNQQLTGAVVRESRLRWPVPEDLGIRLAGQTVESVTRRAKYLLINTAAGTVIVHLGMSGSLRLVPQEQHPEKHDHVDLRLGSGQSLRLRDPRRFGSIHWTSDASSHALIRDLGPEPLSADFNAHYLYQASRNRKVAVKEFIMNAHRVVGVGNIYASESLFRAGIHPFRPAGKISLARYERLVSAIKDVLAEAIEQGGTTLRDFVSSDGKPGYFKQSLSVYGREGEPCDHCGTAVKMARRGQRATFFCPSCQKL